MAGARTMPPMPSTPIATNQSSMIGPNTPPMKPVPRRCTRNKPTSTASVIGRTRRPSAGVSTFRPSTADSTEMAGVMAPSP